MKDQPIPEPLFGRFLKIFLNLVAIAFALVILYLAPLGILARMETPSGGKKFLRSTVFTDTFITEAKNGKPATSVKTPIYTRKLKNSTLDRIYRPILSLGSGRKPEISWLARYILGLP